MKLFDKISNGYKKIASGIAIVAFLAIMYLAMMPLGTHLASAGVFTSQSGEGICGAKVKIVEWQNLWNTTTSCEPSTLGNFTLSGVSYDGTTGTTYTVRAIKEGYGPDSKKVTLNTTNPDVTVNFDLSLSDPLYIPFVADFGSFSTEIMIFNPYESNITVDATAYSSGSNKSYDYEIISNETNSIRAKQIWGSDIAGTVKVDTTKPSKVQGVIKSLSTRIYSMALSKNSTVDTIQYLPFAADFGNYDTGIQIFNPDPVNTITANLTGYSGGMNKTINFTIAPQTLGSRYAEQVWGGDFAGTIKVETTGSALVQGSIRTLSTGTSSITPSTTLKAIPIQYIPFAADFGNYDTGIQIFNPDPVNTITANLTGYSGGVNKTINFTIAPQTLGSRYAEQVWGGDFAGTIKVETTGPSLVQGSIRTLSTGTSSITPARTIPAVNTQYIIFVNDTGTSYDTGIQIFNPDPVNTITANLTAYSGGVNKTINFTIAPERLGSKYAEQVWGGDYAGPIIVETTGPALVQASIRELTSMTSSIVTPVN